MEWLDKMLEELKEAHNKLIKEIDKCAEESAKEISDKIIEDIGKEKALSLEDVAIIRLITFAMVRQHYTSFVNKELKKGFEKLEKENKNENKKDEE